MRMYTTQSHKSQAILNIKNHTCDAVGLNNEIRFPSPHISLRAIDVGEWKDLKVRV